MLLFNINFIVWLDIHNENNKNIYRKLDTVVICYEISLIKIINE